MSETEGRPLAIGAYIFAGGFTVGVRQAGFDVLAHLEGNDYGVSTARLNFPEMPIHVGAANWPLSELKQREVSFLYCNPPCAPWSANGVRSQGKERGMGAWRSDPRVACWHDCFTAFQVLRPRVFAVESVCPVYTDGREMIDDFTRRALIDGYSVTHLLIDAKWHGIPQSRKRFFFVAHRASAFPARNGNWSPPVTIGQALPEVGEIGYVLPTSRTHAPLIEHARPGESLAATWERLTPSDQKTRGPTGKLTGKPFASNRRLPIDRPMGAFTGNTLYHPTEHRALGIEEAKAICGYPPEFKLDGAPTAWWALLARAVMPPVGRWLASCVVRALEAPDGAWGNRTVTRIDLREPDRAPVDLTREYLDDRGRVRIRIRASVAADPVPVTTPAALPTSVAREPPTPPLSSPLPPRSSPPPVAVSGVPLAPDDEESPLTGEGSGRYIQRMWMTGRYARPGGPERLVELVHRFWAGRTTRVGDVRFNYYRLLRDPAMADRVPTWPGRTREEVLNSTTVDGAVSAVVIETGEPPVVIDGSPPPVPLPGETAVAAYLRDER